MSFEPTIFVVDDDPAARDSLCAMVTAQGMKVESFESAEAFLAAYVPERPGCLVLDYSLPGMDGLALQQTLSRLGSLLPVIVVTAYANVPLTVQAMESGAFTLVEKSAVNQDLCNKIKKALEWNANTVRVQTEREEIRRRLETLTPDERRVMDLLISGRSNKQVAAEMELGLRTAELRRARIMEKMKADSLPELVRMVLSANSAGPPIGRE
jgi:FixJ family two-component response regulator